ncbi:Uncharacterised protein [Acinetobacter baumannii]|nr:Uncharacterised protein [Acinetobacter baumannii]
MALSTTCGAASRRRSARIICAAFSAITSTGEQVLPEVRLGMIEASAMRRPGIPCTLNCASTTACGPWPMRQVPAGWKMVVPISAAARCRSSSLRYSGPGLYSCGRKAASAGAAAMRRVRRMASAATFRSRGSLR